VGVLAVAHEPASAALVRRSIADDLSGRGFAEGTIDDVLIAASELVGNAVRHAPPPWKRELEVSWELEPDAVVVRVLDGSAELPMRPPAGVDEPRGRGLAIVAALARDWGVQCNKYGKQVWARVPVRRRAMTTVR
jgi:anti-sigma regulatory factor (Ser/Thr protein kinase)